MAQRKDVGNGGPAFPGICIANPGEFASADAGMSLRDWFAGQALAGIVSDPVWKDQVGHTATGLAKAAYDLADAMLAERAK